MSQTRSTQHGIFHVTTNTCGRIPWCTQPGMPEIIIDNLLMTRSLHLARVYAFCILPDHVHVIVSPGERGISRFVQSWKSHTSRDVHNTVPTTVAESRGFPIRAAAESHDSPLRSLWQKSFYDERIRDTEQCLRALQYVRGNAFKHALSPTPEAWPWSYIHFADRLDPIELW
jgi:putative transposase